jgi:hypothetical protein
LNNNIKGLELDNIFRIENFNYISNLNPGAPLEEPEKDNLSNNGMDSAKDNKPYIEEPRTSIAENIITAIHVLSAVQAVRAKLKGHSGIL